MSTQLPAHQDKDIAHRARLGPQPAIDATGLAPAVGRLPRALPAAFSVSAAARLQRLGGNRALTRMLQGSPRPQPLLAQRMNNPGGSDEDDLYGLPKFGGYASGLDEGEPEEEELEAEPTAIELALAALAEKAKVAIGGELFAPAYREVLYEFELNEEMEWKGLKALYMKQQAGAGPAAQGKKWSDECNAVWDHMQVMYPKAKKNPKPREDGSFPYQSAYFGSDKINGTAGAKKIPLSVIAELKLRVIGTGWYFDSSDSSGASFKKPIKGSKIEPWNFLYKTRPPT